MSTTTVMEGTYVERCGWEQEDCPDKATLLVSFTIFEEPQNSTVMDYGFHLFCDRHNKEFQEWLRSNYSHTLSYVASLKNAIAWIGEYTVKERIVEFPFSEEIASLANPVPSVTDEECPECHVALKPGTFQAVDGKKHKGNCSIGVTELALQNHPDGGKATRVSASAVGTKTRRSTRKTGRKIEPTNAELREWARSNGYEVGDKGRVSNDIKIAYLEAQKK